MSEENKLLALAGEQFTAMKKRAEAAEALAATRLDELTAAAETVGVMRHRAEATEARERRLLDILTSCHEGGAGLSYRDIQNVLKKHADARLRATQSAAPAPAAPVAPAECEAHAHLTTMSDVLNCARAWEPDARIIGNIRAEDIAKAMTWALSARVSAPQGSEDSRSRAVVAEILAERERQKNVEGWTTERDDGYEYGQLGSAAVVYVLSHLTGVGFKPDHRLPAMGDALATYWPWCESWYKPDFGRRDLIKAGALITAEIERLDRAAIAAEGKAVS